MATSKIRKGNFFLTTTNKNISTMISDDFDEITEAVKGWNMEFQKLDTTPFHGEITQCFMPSLVLGKAHFNCRLKQLGETPKGLRTFAIPVKESLNMLWRNQHVDGNDLLLFPDSNELQASISENFNIFTVSIKEELLHEAAERTGSLGLAKAIKSSEVFKCDRTQMDALLSSLQQCLSSQLENSSEDSAVTCDHITDQLVQLMTNSPNISPKNTTKRRLNAVLSADKHILEHPEHPPSIQELCTATRTSKRTLEYAFHEHYKMSPKAYMNNLRLHAVRKQLRAASPENIHVCDAANNWGFWHMGQFAADYRKLFGINPSQTLGCDPKNCQPNCRYSEGCHTCKY